MKKFIKQVSMIFVVLALTITPVLQTVKAADMYTVKTGDSLWKISRRYNVSIEELIDYNNLTDSSNIYIGQNLILNPKENETDNNYSSEKAYFYYTIQPGDILWNIANKYNTTVEKLVELNNIKNAYDLYVDRKLIVPAAENNYPPAEDNDSSNNSGTDNTANKNGKFVPYYFYTIQQGDYLWGIADQFGVRVSTLINYNNIENISALTTGELLIVPLENSNHAGYLKRNSRQLNTYYRVRSNENLNTIADYYKIPEEGIRAINQMNSSETVYTGQKLLMPLSSAFFKKHKIYTVKNGGEYIFDIAYNHNISISSILKANYLKNKSIKFKAGTTLILPLDRESKAVWIDYEDGRPVGSNSWFSN